VGANLDRIPYEMPNAVELVSFAGFVDCTFLG
jgi:hypothetical protein